MTGKHRRKLANEKKHKLQIHYDRKSTAKNLPHQNQTGRSRICQRRILAQNWANALVQQIGLLINVLMAAG
ncbi:10696_t:CDS:2 [Ambispora gerdemannii]|uniref:10696_t:CDS:1 n=1 Tax=Ambispora gerdemannii TaxID=144530 RepID=A0A9N9AK17_9GLOM|nr:10696_t:CDS:2 [Ambispora gerdemannii]